MADKMEKSLPVKLTNNELRAYGDELAKVVGEWAKIKTDKKETAAQYKLQIEALEARMQTIAIKIEQRKEWRMIECYEREDLEAQRLNTIRIDTGEVVNWRVMTQEDIQRKRK